ncbi:MAG: hypothetical protein IID32_12080 [Planctomycetes bacterium]|nr:hypothetical protein [Planctomycetota bacterium]
MAHPTKLVFVNNGRNVLFRNMTMGVAYYIVSEKGELTDEISVDGKRLAIHSDRIGVGA